MIRHVARRWICLGFVSFTWPCLTGAASAEKPKSPLIKLPVTFGTAMENTPVIYQNKPHLALNFRDDSKNATGNCLKDMHLYILDLCTGMEVTRFGAGHSFVNALVNGPEMHVFASQADNKDWFHDIYHFSSTDFKTWKRELALRREAGEHLLNTSVCRDEHGYLMACESDKPIAFCFGFARSKDLSKWERIPQLIFTGETKEYSACPVVRYFKPYYYVIYLHTAISGHNGFVSFLARSTDLAAWQLSPLNPILEAGPGEGCNNSDVDLFEWEGNTYLFYATGDQKTWGSVRVAMYPGPMQKFYESCFPAGTPMVEVSAKTNPATPPTPPSPASP
jgi:hypothetical protein